MRQDPLAALANGLTAGFEIARKNREDFRKQQEHEQNSKVRSLEIGDLERKDRQAQQDEDRNNQSRARTKSILGDFTALLGDTTAPAEPAAAPPPATRLPMSPEVPPAPSDKGPLVLPGLAEDGAAPKAPPSGPAANAAAPQDGDMAARKIQWMRNTSNQMPLLNEQDRERIQGLRDRVRQELISDRIQQLREGGKFKPGTQEYLRAYFDVVTDLDAQMGTFDIQSHLDNTMKMMEFANQSKVQESQIASNNASARASDARTRLADEQTSQLEASADANQETAVANAAKARYEAALKQAEVNQDLAERMLRHLDVNNTKGAEELAAQLYGKGTTLEVNPNGEITIDGQAYKTTTISIERDGTQLFGGPVDYLRHVLEATQDMKEWKVVTRKDRYGREELVAYNNRTFEVVPLVDGQNSLADRQSSTGVPLPAPTLTPAAPTNQPQPEQGAQNTSQTERELDPNVNPTTGKRWAEGDQFMYGKDLMKVIRDPQTGNLQAVPVQNTIENRTGVPPNSNEPGGA